MTQYDENITNALEHTLIGDDIDMIVNLVDQLRDLDDGNILEEATTQIPEAEIHQKRWMDVNIKDLAEALYYKYANAKRLAVPMEFRTPF